MKFKNHTTIFITLVFSIIVCPHAFGGRSNPPDDEMYGWNAALSTTEHYGAISGQITEECGDALAGVTVTIPGTELSDITDDSGNYLIDNIPVAAPRYIVTAVKQGFLTGQAGNINIENGRTATVNLILQTETPEEFLLREKLKVMICHIIRVEPTGKKLRPALNAVLDSTLYPENVKPYLNPGTYIEADDPSIVEVAHKIIDGLPEQFRNKQTLVAKAVYNWMVKNISYDLLTRYPRDVTCGHWQTTVGGAWGHNIGEWCYTAKEVLMQQRGICIEFERLCTALLRASGIPARPAPVKSHPVTQWWVQLPDGSGYWANMETSFGSLYYEATGSLWERFPGRSESEITFHAINENAPLHMDWQTDNPCLWTEDFGQNRLYELNSESLEIAEADMKSFSEWGLVPSQTAHLIDSPAETDPHYVLYTWGVTIDLANLGSQKTMEVLFAMPMDNKYRKRVKTVHWTSHNSFIDSTDTETQRDSQTGEELTCYKITFNFL